MESLILAQDKRWRHA